MIDRKITFDSFIRAAMGATSALLRSLVDCLPDFPIGTILSVSLQNEVSSTGYCLCYTGSDNCWHWRFRFDYPSYDKRSVANQGFSNRVF